MFTYIVWCFPLLSNLWVFSNLMEITRLMYPHYILYSNAGSKCKLIRRILLVYKSTKLGNRNSTSDAKFSFIGGGDGLASF